MNLPRPILLVITNARKWAFAQASLAKLRDSRSAKPEDLDKAKKTLADAAHALFKAVQELERFLSKPASKSSFDWGAVFGMIAKTAGMLEGVAAAAKGASAPQSRVIDTQGETIPE